MQAIITFLETPLFKELRAKGQTSLHLLFEKQNLDNCPSIGIPKAFPPNNISLESIKKYGDVTNNYPANVARNIARKGIKTELFITGDIEQFYVQNFESRMFKLAKRVLLE